MMENDVTKTSNSNEDYAQQWIEYLKERNARLNVIWPVLMVLNVALLGACLYFYQDAANKPDGTLVGYQLDEAKAALDKALAANSTLEESQKALEKELEIQTKKNSELEEGFSTIQNAIKDDAGQLAGLMKEVATLKLELNNKNDRINVLEGESASKLASVETKFQRNTAELNRQLKASKTAYSALAKRQKETVAEMDRLSSLLSKKNAEVSIVVSERERLRQSLLSTQSEMSVLRESNRALEIKLENLSLPLTSKSEGSASKRAPQVSQSNVSAYSTIQAPQEPINKTEQSSKATSNQYSFDQIAID